MADVAAMRTITMTRGQFKAFQIFKSMKTVDGFGDRRTNFLLLGAGGVGKTMCIKAMANDDPYGIVVSFQNSMAVKMNGVTIHRFAGLSNPKALQGDIERLQRRLAQQMTKGSAVHPEATLYIVELMNAPHILIELLERVCRQARMAANIKHSKDRLFGGMRIIADGDVLQMAPFKTREEVRQVLMPCRSPVMAVFDFIITLNRNMRMADPAYADVLRIMRLGSAMSPAQKETVVKHFEALVRPLEPEEVLTCIKMVPHRKSVAEENARRLAAVPSPPKDIPLLTYVVDVDEEAISESARAGSTVHTLREDIKAKTQLVPPQLKVGARIIVKSKLSKDVVTGMTGDVIRIDYPEGYSAKAAKEAIARHLPFIRRNEGNAWDLYRTDDVADASEGESATKGGPRTALPTVVAVFDRLDGEGTTEPMAIPWTITTQLLRRNDVVQLFKDDARLMETVTASSNSMVGLQWRLPKAFAIHLPIQLGYAITTHGSQGCDMHKYVVGDAHKMWAKGHFYVAASRGTRSDSMRLLTAPDWNKCLRQDEQAEEFLSRLALLDPAETAKMVAGERAASVKPYDGPEWRFTAVACEQEEDGSASEWKAPSASFPQPSYVALMADPAQRQAAATHYIGRLKSVKQMDLYNHMISQEKIIPAAKRFVHGQITAATHRDVLKRHVKAAEVCEEYTRKRAHDAPSTHRLRDSAMRALSSASGVSDTAAEAPPSSEKTTDPVEPSSSKRACTSRDETLGDLLAE
jgi:hypothetical protein